MKTTAIYFHYCTVLVPGNETCVVGKCYYCKKHTTMCPHNGQVEVSMAYWVNRKLQLHTQPPKYMPFSTPRIDELVPY